jgi:hypothetical protein
MTTRLSRRFFLLTLLSTSTVGTLSCLSRSSRALARLPQRGNCFASTPFTVYDSLMYGEKPDVGMAPILVASNGFWKGDDDSKPDETACRQFARESCKKYSKIVIDIDRWAFDTRCVSKQDAQAGIDKILQIVRWMKNEQPKLQIGFYGFPVHSDDSPSACGDIKIKTWKSANDFLSAIADVVDFISPSLETFYPDVRDWVANANATILEAKRFGKPVLPFLWNRYQVSNLQFRSRDYWRTQLQTVRESGVEGVVLWDWFGFSDRANPALDQTQAWWRETAEFIRQS